MDLSALEIHDININDYQDYLDLMYEFSNFRLLPPRQFEQDPNTIIKVIVLKGEIIGAGSLFILKKLHCNPFGQIEDVIIKEKFRGRGLGKMLIDHLVQVGKDLKCYKVCLNSNPSNKNFYEKCGFIESGLQFKNS